MNELSNQTMQLPDTLEDLSKFTLIGREKLNAVRAEIRAIEKVGLAKEVHEQKLHEAQEIAEAVLDAETRIGELTSRMVKATNQYASNNGVTTKNKQLEEIGLSKMQTSRFETLAKHPEQVEKAKVEARNKGKIVTRQDVFNKISSECYPDKRQQEARELREAKRRAETYDASEKVVNFGEAKQHGEDNDLIFKEYADKIDKMHTDILHVVISGNNEVTLSALKAADRRELIRLQDVLSDCYRSILKAQRQVVEVIEGEK